MKSINICIVGTHQTGSTRLFNLIRMIYEIKGKTVYSKWSIDPIEIEQMSSKYDIILSKIHDTDSNYLKNYHIILLPMRNILDSALSAGIRRNNTSTNFYISDCNSNIELFNKFKPHSHFIFRYENYSVYYIKLLCTILNVKLNNNDIIEIMVQLEKMLNSKDIVKIDNHRDKVYVKTLLSQSHNTSNGKINKYINLPTKQLNDILKETNISNFLEENFYF